MANIGQSPARTASHPVQTRPQIDRMESMSKLELAVAIQTTQMLLEQWQREAGELEQQWLYAKSRCASLAEELQAYTLQYWPLTPDQDQVTEPRRQTSLIDLPDELLCDIFEYATYLCHPSIRSLLLVCKRFHLIIMGTSSLWTRVDIIFPDDLMERFFPSKVYVEACLERSRGRLLDITVKQPRKGSSRDYAIEWIEKNITPVIGAVGAGRVVETLECDGGWDTCDDSPVEKRVTQMYSVVSSVVGAAGEHTSRWKSVFITVPPEEGPFFPLWFMEDYPAPNLQRIEIVGSMEDWDCEREPLPTMPNLRSLKMDDSWTYLDWVEPPTSLTHLDTVYDFGAIFNDLHVFHNLHHLCIRNAIDYSMAESEDPITLSRLSELHIHGHGNRIFAMLVAPRLETLCVWSSQTSITEPLPSVPSIEWIYNGTSEPEMADVLRQNTLSSILRKVTKTRCLSLRGFPAEMVDEIANRHQRAGEISTSLKTVEVLTDDARMTVCDWDTIYPE